MVANGGVVKAKLILDSSEFSSGWKKALKELDTRIRGPDTSGLKKELSDTGEAAKKTKSDLDLINNSKFDRVTNGLDEIIKKVKGVQSVKPIELEVKPRNIDETIRKIRELGAQGKKSEEEVKQINNSRFDKLVSNIDGVINKMRSTVSSGVTSIRNDITSGINAVDFNNLSNKFSATIQRMQSTASAGVKSITNEFSSMEAGLTDIFATVAGGAGLQQIFQYGMGRATTQAMLSNSETPQDAATIMSQYQKYTVASSTQDQDIQRVLKYVIQGAAPTQTYQALSAIDAAAFTPDPVQRQELLRNYGQYLTSGYSAALFRGDVTPEEAAILQSAKTPEERIAAMETIAKNKGSMTETGENLSTLTTGPMANYNKALIITDTLMRGMTDGFNKFMDAISPLMDWFIALDPKTQTTIGNLIFFAGILGMAGGAIKILGSVFSPFIGILKSVGSGALQVASKLGQMIPTDKISTVLGKLKDVAGNGISSMSDKVVEGLSGLKDKVSGPLNTVKDAITSKFSELEQWIQNRKTSSTSSGTTTTGGGSSLGVGGAIALTAMAVYVTADAIYAYGKAQEKYEETGDPVRSAAYGIGTFTENLPLPWIMNKILGKPSITAEGEEEKEWNKSKGFLSFFGQNPLDSIFPKGVSAAGGAGGSGIMNDIFGKNGALDFSRFGLKMPDIKWPNAGQILNKITDTIKSHIPKLNWKIPTIGSIGNWVQDKITSLGWKIPSIGSVGNWVQDKINWAIWQIPSLGSVGQWVVDKITWLVWQIPGAQAIFDYIKSIIPAFHWPWGPGGGTQAGSVATTIGSRASTLISNAQGPRGPLTDNVISTMSALSGVSSGYVSQSMANNFSGVPGFTPIANALSDHLGYEFYFGDGKSDSEVWNSGTCNCYDGAQLLATEAGIGFGLGTGLTPGVWDGTSIPHTWATIGGQPFDMAAKLIRGHWNPPSGPKSMFDKILMDIGPGLEYEGYGGHKYDPITALTNRGNCFDMTLGVMNMAAASGLPSEMIWGHWGDQSHVWARVAGTDYDPASRAITGNYSPPPQGPGDPSSTEDHIHVHFNGEVFGLEDFESKVKGMVKQGDEEKARRIKRRRFGG